MKRWIIQTHFIRKANSFSILIRRVINGTGSIRRGDCLTESVNTSKPDII